MKVLVSNGFKKSYDRLDKIDRNRVDRTIDVFCKNPFHTSLNNHRLHGELSELRSIKAGFDLRILYFEEGGHVVVTFIKAGKHADVY